MALNSYSLTNQNKASASKINIAQAVKTALANKGRAVMQFLSARREPVITQRFDLQGCPYWEIYNPATQQNYYCLTETEVLIWLETHYR
ncbi:hypothetical protein H6G89_04710 [Oscillatoria sp. FACHB-1407]|uniref:hypothetical protein n=1 Tax=Oscillatoria sp. FACHB-1407 TaxID=2692847 RepID=UPI001684554D|nr:hypothetical protein [Oscillatoria sp. FACHB-1407]MBD2460339.1 hypothetical protein [Oscillatoria sp. FACHB-1407]